MNKYLFIIIFLLSAGSLLHGQNNYRNKIRSMFDKTSNGLWIKSYQGTFDNSFPVTIYMGTSENQCRAIIRYNQEKKLFSLEGSFDNNDYVLHEYDSNGLQTGTMYFQLLNNQIKGEWIGINGLKKYPIALTKNKPNTNIKKRVVSPYFNTFYSSLDNQTRINLNQQIDNLSLQIIVNGTMNEWILYDQRLENKEWVVSKEKINYRVIPIGDDKLLLKIDYPDRQENHHLTLTKTLDFSSETKLTYDTKAEVHFPYLNEEKFDAWMEKIIQNIWESQISLLVMNNSNNGYSPYDRHNNELFIYTEVHSYTAYIISGLIYIQNKNLNHIETIPFSYNLDKNKAIEIAKLFKKRKKEEIFRQYTSQAYQKATQLPEGLEKQWLLSCPYNYAILTQDAIELYTPFNMIFGNTRIRIPFVEIHDSIKNIPN